jgi:hypothetical protein
MVSSELRIAFSSWVLRRSTTTHHSSCAGRMPCTSRRLSRADRVASWATARRGTSRHVVARRGTSRHFAACLSPFAHPFAHHFPARSIATHT